MYVLMDQVLPLYRGCYKHALNLNHHYPLIKVSHHKARKWTSNKELPRAQIQGVAYCQRLHDAIHSFMKSGSKRTLNSCHLSQRVGLLVCFHLSYFYRTFRCNLSFYPILLLILYSYRSLSLVFFFPLTFLKWENRRLRSLGLIDPKKQYKTPNPDMGLC